MRIKTADEEHEGGKLKTIVQAQIRLSLMSKIVLGLSALAAAALMLAAPALDLALAGMALIAALLVVNEAVDTGRKAYWAIEQCAADLGLVPLGLPPARLPESVPAGASTELVPEKRADS